MLKTLSLSLGSRPTRLCCAAALLLGFAVTEPMPVRGDHDVYKKVAPSTVGFYKRQENTKGIFDGFYGSGVLVDVERKLVVTAEHVVREFTRHGKKVHAMFPLKDEDGNLITEALLYKRRHKQLKIAGTVVYQDRLKDIALVELDKLPEGVQAVALARTEPRVGDAVHVIGNSNYSVKGSPRTMNLGAAFGYSTGKVRNVYHFHGLTSDLPLEGEPKAQAPFGPPAEMFFALVHHAPANPGDSGGPVVNNDGELVGIVSRGDGAMVLSTDVHVKEIRRALDKIQFPATDQITMHLSADSDKHEDTSSTDNFYLPVRSGEAIHVSLKHVPLKGEPRAKLDLYAKDLGAKPSQEAVTLERLLRKFKAEDAREGSFTPDWDGVCLIQAINRGDETRKKFRTDYTLTITRETKVPGPFTIMRQLSPGGTDRIQLHYTAGKGKARISLRGDHDMNLDLTVLDPSDKKLAESAGPTDVEEVTWTPAETGVYTVLVESKNLINPARKEPIWSQYVLTTD